MSENEERSLPPRVVILITKAGRTNKSVARLAVVDDPASLTRQVDYPAPVTGCLNRAAVLKYFGNARERSEVEAKRDAPELANKAKLEDATPFLLNVPHINFPARPKSAVRGASRSVPPSAPEA